MGVIQFYDKSTVFNCTTVYWCSVLTVTEGWVRCGTKQLTEPTDLLMLLVRLILNQSTAENIQFQYLNKTKDSFAKNM